MSSAQSQVTLSDPESEGKTSIDYEKQQPTEEKPEGRQVHGIKWALLAIAIYLTAFLYGLDTTIAADVQTVVSIEFNNVSEIGWLGTGFPLGSIGTILLFGALYGKFDQKWLYISSLALFEIGSIICGAATGMNMMIAGRVIAGIGGAGMYLGALNYLSELTTPNERGAYISIIGFSWGVGTILGPIIGGSFADSSASWRWAFYINAPLGALFAPVLLLWLPSSVLGTGTVLDRLAKIDWIGFILSATTFSVFTVVFTFSGTTWAWNDSRSIALLVVFGVVWIAFVVHQIFSKGLLPVYLLKLRTQILLYIATSSATALLFSPLYFLPIYFQFVAGDSALLAAVRILPFVAFFVAANVLSGFLLPKIGYANAIYLLGGILGLAGGAALFTIDTQTSKGAVYGYSILVGIGTGLTAQIGYTVATIHASKICPQAIVDAVSLQNFAQIGSIVISLVISGQIFQSVAFRNLSAVLVGYSDADIKSAVAGASSTVLQSLTPEMKEKAIEAIVAAMSDVYATVIVAGGLLILSALLMRIERVA